MADNALVNNCTHTLDAKNRVFFPAKYREELGAPIVITVSTDRCLAAYSLTEWTAFVDKLKSLPKTQVKDITRFFCGNAVKCVPDGQGRVLLSDSLVQFAEIKTNITFIGCGDRVELWASEKSPMGNYDEKFVANIYDSMLELGL